MKKYLAVVILGIILYFVYDYTIFYQGEVYLPYKGEVQSFTKSEDGKLWVDQGQGFEVFNVKGVNLGLGKPGKFATEYSVSKEEYLRWFKQIKNLGANVIRTYTLAHEEFYEAFYEFNQDNLSPLYLIHGVSVDDYLVNSHRNAFNEQFHDSFLNSCKDTIDVINGRHKSSRSSLTGAQNYKYDISSWVYGYIVGVEWDGDIVAFTNKTGPQLEQFVGEYLETKEANNFEIFLARIGDEMIDYETSKYGKQRTLAFLNWAETDPFDYPENIALQFRKIVSINVEHIKSREKFIGGHYATYHIYPYYPEYSRFLDKTVENTYLDYLTKLNDHHELPVVISEFGVPSSRGIEAYEQNAGLGRNQGHMSEKEQGYALTSLYKDIKTSGSAGGIVFLWQDEWFKQASNTIPFVNSKRIAHWSDAQTNTQAFGLLSFDPGQEESICYVDGEKSEWTEEDLVSDHNGFRISMKYDEKYIYFLAEKENLEPTKDQWFIPIDTTDKSGSNFVKRFNLQTSHPTDFVIEINTQKGSRVWVQERYNKTHAIFGNQISRTKNIYEHPPALNSSQFDSMEMVLNEFDYFYENKPLAFEDYNFASSGNKYYYLFQTYETGKLTHGNGHPKSTIFNSLTDFSFGENFVEIRLPWQMLNFSDPSQMLIHDDYYVKYGVEFQEISELFVGLGDGVKLIPMESFKLEKLGKKPKYHERLKQSYTILQSYWKNH